MTIKIFGLVERKDGVTLSWGVGGPERERFCAVLSGTFWWVSGPKARVPVSATVAGTVPAGRRPEKGSREGVGCAHRHQEPTACPALHAGPGSLAVWGLCAGRFLSSS